MLLMLRSYSEPALDLISEGNIEEKLLTASRAVLDLNSTLPVAPKASDPTMKFMLTMLPRTWTNSTTSDFTAAKRLFTESGVQRDTAAMEL